MADITGAGGGAREHRIQIPAAQQHGAAGQGKAKAKADDAPEKRLNRFVRAVALIERTGNALGTLAFTWATVILLGGYPTVLHPDNDFWFATVIVFLEAARILSRDNNMSDYQLFFRTRGAFKSLGWNGLVLTVCVSDIFMWSLAMGLHGRFRMLLLIATIVIVPFLFPGAAGLPTCSPLRLGISLWSPMTAILLLYPSALYSYDSNYQVHTHISRKSIAKWIVYLVLFVVVLLLTITRLRFPRIIKLVDNALGSKLLSWRQDILNMCMFAAIGMSVSTFDNTDEKIVIIMIDVCIFVIVSFGNLQFPATVLRVVLALRRLIPHNYNSGGGENKNDPGTNNLAPSLNIFYGMVLGQGILYIVACILEAFSFFLRRSLIRLVGFRGKVGEQYVNLYYAYAFEKCMVGAMFAGKKINLVTFAMDCLNLDSPKMQLYGVQMLHNFLQKDPLKTIAISKLTTSTRTLALLFNMLGWTSEADKYIRKFSAKVIVELSYNLRISPIPGAVQLVSSLLDTVHQPEIIDPLLDTDIQIAKEEVIIKQVSGNRENSPTLKSWRKMAMYCFIPSDTDGQKSRILGYFKQFTKWSVPEEELVSVDHDLLPVLGLTIIDRLGCVDLGNNIEITKATGIISKIIEFTNNKADVINIDETLMKGSSLKVLKRLSSVKGIFGVTLRQQISEHPFLLSNLAEILHDIRSNQEHRKMAAEILRNLAVDRHKSAEIGHIQGTISSLMHAFLKRDAPSSADSGHMLQKIAGQALAVLTTESANNCLIMLVESGYLIIKELTIMIQGNKFRCVSASLLCNMCVHVQSELKDYNLKEISCILREVLEGIMEAEGAELEILVGLSSQICNIIPKDFVRELEHGQIKEIFIKRLVHALNANMVPTSRCPGIRRAIIEQAIYMMECNPSYTECFKNYSMMDALLMVERTPSKTENYRKFLGDAGLMEHSTPLSALVARAKKCMSIVT